MVEIYASTFFHAVRTRAYKSHFLCHLDFCPIHGLLDAKLCEEPFGSKIKLFSMNLDPLPVKILILIFMHILLASDTILLKKAWLKSKLIAHLKSAFKTEPIYMYFKHFWFTFVFLKKISWGPPHGLVKKWVQAESHLNTVKQIMCLQKVSRT